MKKLEALINRAMADAAENGTLDYLVSNSSISIAFIEMGELVDGNEHLSIDQASKGKFLEKIERALNDYDFGVVFELLDSDSSWEIDGLSDDQFSEEIFVFDATEGRYIVVGSTNDILSLGGAEDDLDSFVESRHRFYSNVFREAFRG